MASGPELDDRNPEGSRAFPSLLEGFVGKVEPGLTSLVTCSGSRGLGQGPSGCVQGVGLERLALGRGQVGGMAGRRESAQHGGGRLLSSVAADHRHLSPTYMSVAAFTPASPSVLARSGPF